PLSVAIAGPTRGDPFRLFNQLGLRTAGHFHHAAGIANYGPLHFARSLSGSQGDRMFQRLPTHIGGFDFDGGDQRVEHAVQFLLELMHEVSADKCIEGAGEDEQHGRQRREEEDRYAGDQLHSRYSSHSASSTYPSPRRVWMTRGPYASSFRR